MTLLINIALIDLFYECEGSDIASYADDNAILRGGSRTPATSNVELYVIIVNGFQLLSIITKSSALDVAVVLGPSLTLLRNWNSTVIAELQITANKLFHCFEYNHHKTNRGKSHLLLSTKSPISVPIGDVSLTTSSTETFLRIIIDSELSFDQHLSSVCSKTSNKLHALGPISG